MKHSLYIRNFFANALVVLISFIILGGLSTAWSYRISATERHRVMFSTLRETVAYVSTQHRYYGVELSDLNLSMWLAMISGVSGFDLLLCDADGVVSSCSDRDFRHLGKTVPDYALTQAASSGGRVFLGDIGRIYPERREAACAVLSAAINGETVVYGYLFISNDPTAYRDAWRQFSGVFTLIALGVMAMTFVITFFTTKKQAEALVEMAGAASRFARGDFSTRVGNCGRTDEIGQLTQAFNAMADSLESSETHRREFIANISHELKTPMTVIAGFAEGILDGTIPRESEVRYLSVISSETRRLSRLVGSMLDLSRLQSADPGDVLRGSFDIAEVVRLALLSLEGKIEDRKLGVEAELPEDAVMARGDKDSITRVVYNLIDNAIKFSKPDGVVTLELWKQGGLAYVAVENSGETIPARDLPHIFDRFHKADKSRSADRDGVGLGLYIVKTILDSHNGDIFVTSANGVTKFVFSLELAGG
jgi:signal transduction histidine kinase